MMKKVLISIIALVCGLSALGQDVIITKDAQRIEGFIINLTTTEVQYKVSVDSPVKVLPTAQINTILFQNGQVKVYNDNTPRQPQVSATAPQTPVKTAEQQPEAQAPAQTTIAPNAVTTYNIANPSNHPTYAYVSRSGNTYYYEGRSMNKEVYCKFLENRCYPAYQKAYSGYLTTVVGWTLLGCGAAVDLVGAICFVADDMLGVALSSFGSCLEIASVPTLIVGYAKMHKSVDLYNAQCGAKAQYQPYWSVQTSQNGIGLALNF